MGLLFVTKVPITTARRHDKCSRTLMKRPEVEAAVGLSCTASIYRLMDEGAFPRPIRIGKRAVRWRGDGPGFVARIPPRDHGGSLRIDTLKPPPGHHRPGAICSVCRGVEGDDAVYRRIQALSMVWTMGYLRHLGRRPPRRRLPAVQPRGLAAGPRSASKAGPAYPGRSRPARRHPGHHPGAPVSHPGRTPATYRRSPPCWLNATCPMTDPSRGRPPALRTCHFATTSRPESSPTSTAELDESGRQSTGTRPGCPRKSESSYALLDELDTVLAALGDLLKRGCGPFGRQGSQWSFLWYRLAA